MLSWINPKIEVRDTDMKGRGLFSTQPIKKDEVVVIQAGKIVENSEIDEPPLCNFRYDCFQIEEGFYICPADMDAGTKEGVFLMNHSCEPNCGVRGQATFVAMRDIEPDEELAYEYAMTDVYHDGVGWENMECLCGTPSCRDIITGNDWRRKDMQEKFKGYFSHYVQKMIDAEHG